MNTKNAHSSTKSGTRKFLRDVSHYGKSFGLLLIASMIAEVLLALSPKLSGKITDYLKEVYDTGILNYRHLVFLCLFLAMCYFFGHAIGIFVNKKTVFIVEGYSRRIRTQIQEKLNKLPLKYFDTHSKGEILSYVTNDINSFASSMESTAPSMISQSVLLVAVFVFIFSTNWKLSLIYCVALPVNFFFTTYIAKHSRKQMKEQKQTVANLSSITDDTFNNHIIVKSYCCEQKRVNEYTDESKRYFSTYTKSRFYSGFVMPVSILVSSISFAVLCLIGSIQILNGSLTIGEFQAFVFYGNMVQGPLLTIANSISNLQNAFSSIDRVYHFLDEEEEKEEAPISVLDVQHIKGNVEFSDVSFGYFEDRILMNNVSFRADAGKTFAIVGPSGAGKTTLVNLLLRFYEIKGGKILIDDIDTLSVSKKNLRQIFGMVLQDTWVMGATIAENIRFGKPDATLDEIKEAAKSARCDRFIEKLPDGYDTVISQESSELSAGEKQLLTIARTIISNPVILILDEATSNVDTRTETLITEAMENLMHGRTCFVIAHRLYTIRNADQIIYMQNGDVKEVGNHAQLMEKNGLYASMYNNMKN